ncbi:MAG: hypothetical protein KBF93_20215 [Leptospiraceae bacterium]|nr:hypothetical protein [Leptospiraceae bacterium]
MYIKGQGATDCSGTATNGATLVRNGSPKTGKDIAKFAGIWKDRKDISDSLDYARKLRKKAHTRNHIQEALKNLNRFC